MSSVWEKTNILFWVHFQCTCNFLYKRRVYKSWLAVSKIVIYLLYIILQREIKWAFLKFSLTIIIPIILKSYRNFWWLIFYIAIEKLSSSLSFYKSEAVFCAPFVIDCANRWIIYKFCEDVLKYYNKRQYIKYSLFDSFVCSRVKIKYITFGYMNPTFR